MTENKSTIDNAIHRQLAVNLFNETWDLIEKKDRNKDEDDLMINTAHASRYHWGIVGTHIHFARGEWQISRVYSLVGRYESAIKHANDCLQICTEHELSAFDLGFAYEALARGYAVRGDVQESDKYIDLAKQTAEQVDKEADRNWLLKNMDTVVFLTIPD